jgi:beta-phosphoglucomutase-like phosphatase (HAD superfamily)
VKLKALIFDVDGTLADTEDAHRCAFNAAFEEHGLEWNWSKPKYADLLLTAGGKERLAAYVDSLSVTPDERRALRERIAAIHHSKTEGVARLIGEARRAKIRLAIASTTTLANIDALLRINLGSEARELFAVIGAGDEVPRKKPAPDIYKYVLRKLAEPGADCAAIEDSALGLKAAKAAGLFTIVTPSYWTRGEDFSEADLVLPSLGSPGRPLPARAAALVGNPVLGIREIEQRLRAVEMST